MWKSICLVTIFAAAGQACIAADEPKSPARQQVKMICQNLQTATVRIRSRSDVASGVIVSRSGLILTVAHGLPPGSDTATVVFPEGKSCAAKRVVVDEQADIALLVMDVTSLADVAWSTVPLSAAEDLVAGEVILASGYPARESDGRTPVIRLGQILGVNESAVKSSCILTSGDSGGPLVNSRGELVGLNRQIGFGVDSNEHITLTAIRLALEKSRNWKSLTAQPNSGATLMSKAPIPSQQVKQVVRRATVEVHGNNREGEPGMRVLGTVLDDQHVATKLSEIAAYHDLSCRFADGSVIAATVSKSDRTLDLALMKLAVAYRHGKAIAEAPTALWNSTPFIGEIVFAATDANDVSTAGLLSRIGHDEPRLPARFGAVLESNGNQVQITELSPNGSAMSAGLRSGDTLKTVDGTNVSSLQSMSNLLTTRQPGDWIWLGVDRATEHLTMQAQLQHDPGQQFEKTEFLDGRAGRVSQRRSGFKAVLQHDIAIEPVACGGPLLNSNGHIIAISIARRAREATLAIPIVDVIEFSR